MVSFWSLSRTERLLDVSEVRATDVLELQVSHTCRAVVTRERSSSTVDLMGRLHKQLSMIARNMKSELVNYVSGWIRGGAKTTWALVLFAIVHGRENGLGNAARKINANGQTNVENLGCAFNLPTFLRFSIIERITIRFICILSSERTWHKPAQWIRLFPIFIFVDDVLGGP